MAVIHAKYLGLYGRWQPRRAKVDPKMPWTALQGVWPRQQRHSLEQNPVMWETKPIQCKTGEEFKTFVQKATEDPAILARQLRYRRQEMMVVEGFYYPPPPSGQLPDGETMGQQSMRAIDEAIQYADGRSQRGGQIENVGFYVAAFIAAGGALVIALFAILSRVE